jgi:hypothetical protein
VPATPLVVQPTTTLLPPTCTDATNIDLPIWTPVTGSVVPGDSYTVTLTSHDDNAPGTATYALWDDVVVY